MCNGGYADAAAAAFAGGGDGGFAGFGAGDFAGFGDGALGVCFTFDASRRLDASTCNSLGSPFPIDAAYVIVGLLAALAAFASRPVLLDLAFDFGAGSDDGLAMPHGVFFVIRFIASSLVSSGKWSKGSGRVGTDGCDGSISGGAGDGDFAGLSFRRFSARL